LSDLERIQERIRTFYYSTLIPVNIIENGIIVYSLPENVNNISNIISNSYTIEDIFISVNNDDNIKVKAFYYKNEYDECFTILDLKENRHIIIGPTLSEKLYESHVNNIIREKKLPIKLKTKLVNYYESLLIIDSTRFYYCGKLLENIFEEPLIHNINESTYENTISISDEYFASVVRNRESLFHHPPYFLEQELLTKIKTGNLKDSLMLLKEINSLKRSKLSQDTLRSIKNSLICSITIFTRASIEGGVQPETAFTLSDSLILEIEEMNNPSKLIECEAKAVEQYVKLVHETSINNYSNNIKQALSYIHKNLSAKLVLKDIASTIYVHPNYLSTLFKKEVGLNLSDYITKARIEESKYYIKYTNTKITEIALFYQFCNQSYYTLAFKKFIGFTPKEYRIKFNYSNK
jgi:YesN/AraC family two-component response regulator